MADAEASQLRREKQLAADRARPLVSEVRKAIGALIRADPPQGTDQNAGRFRREYQERSWRAEVHRLARLGRRCEYERHPRRRGGACSPS